MRERSAVRLRNNATEITSLLVTGLWLALLVSGAGGGLWLAVLLVGYIVVVPIVALLFGDETDIEEWWDEDERERLRIDEESLDSESTRDALETLRERYAAGELTDEQFEHKLDRLLEVETLEDVERMRGPTEQRSGHDSASHRSSRDSTDREAVGRESDRDPREREFET